MNLDDRSSIESDLKRSGEKVGDGDRGLFWDICGSRWSKTEQKGVYRITNKTIAMDGEIDLNQRS